MEILSKRAVLIASMALLGMGACTNNDDESTVSPIETVKDRYFLAASGEAGTYMMAVGDLEKDTTVSTNTAIETQIAYSRFGSSGTKAIIGLNYQQGNASPGAIYQLNASGVLKQMDEFLLPVGFTTIGNFGKYLATSRSGRTLTGANEGKLGAIFYLINLENNNSVEEKIVLTENFIGNRTAEFTGIVDAGNEEFLTGVKLIAPTGQAAASHDSVFVARLDANMNVKQIFADNRLSYSGGEYRSARYSHIENDADGNTYVFSGSHSATTTKNAGALLIKKGANSFDQSYYFDIQSASGGYKFKRVWHMSEDYFFLEMYNDANVGGGQNPATQYGVVRMSTKEFKWVRSGMPAVDQIDATGWTFTTNGKAYIGITTSDNNPAVYSIDPKTATAKKGISVSGTTSILGLGRLTPQSTIN